MELSPSWRRREVKFPVFFPVNKKGSRAPASTASQSWTFSLPLGIAPKRRYYGPKLDKCRCDRGLESLLTASWGPKRTISLRTQLGQFPFTGVGERRTQSLTQKGNRQVELTAPLPSNRQDCVPPTGLRDRKNSGRILASLGWRAGPNRAHNTSLEFGAVEQAAITRVGLEGEILAQSFL